MKLRPLNLAGAMGAIVALSACGATSEPVIIAPEELNVFSDISTSGASDDPRALSRLTGAITEEMGQMMTGDTVRLHLIGDASLGNILDARTLPTGVDRPMENMGNMAVQELERLVEASTSDGSDTSTSILQALNRAAPECGTRGGLLIYSDGLEVSAEANFESALALGQKLSLPALEADSLRGCRIRWLGLGEVRTNPATQREEILSMAQLRQLKQVWQATLEGAGVAPEDITFE